MNTEPRNGGWMQSYTGRKIWPVDPRPEDIDLADIAHALSNLCRYGGHCKRFYSVAEHSVHVSYMVPTRYAKEALMHDASEAYLVDVPRPLKRLLPDYKVAEDKQSTVIAGKYGLKYPWPEEVHTADNQVMLYLEAPELLGPELIDGWGSEMCIPKPLVTVRLRCYGPILAKLFFLRRAHELGLHVEE